MRYNWLIPHKSMSKVYGMWNLFICLHFSADLLTSGSVAPSVPFKQIFKKSSLNRKKMENHNINSQF